MDGIDGEGTEASGITPTGGNTADAEFVDTYKLGTVKFTKARTLLRSHVLKTLMM